MLLWHLARKCAKGMRHARQRDIELAIHFSLHAAPELLFASLVPYLCVVFTSFLPPL